MPTISLHGWDIVVEQNRKWMRVEKWNSCFSIWSTKIKQIKLLSFEFHIFCFRPYSSHYIMLSKIFLFRDFTPYSICTNVNQKLVIFLFIFSYNYNISSLYCMYNFCLLADCVAVIIILLQLQDICCPANC